MKLIGRLCAFFIGLVLLWTREVQAIAPGYIPDSKLAMYPIIVVATWDKAPWEPHNEYRSDQDLGRVVIKSEAYTRLNIRSVIKGAVEPGIYDLKIGYGIVWREDGTFVSSGTSTEILGDVEDVTRPCLWFLRQTRSWKENRKTVYLSVSNYREIQPLEFKEYFTALGNADATMHVPKLLTPDDPAVSIRVLRYVCGGNWPWPYDSEARYRTPQVRGVLLSAEADRVWALTHADAQKLRCFAASVYAELLGKECIQKIRTVVDNDDPVLRGIAVGILARHRDEVSLNLFPKALEGVTDGRVACKVVEALAAWNDERVVSSLIGFLQNDSFVYQDGDDLGIPALKARQALLAITGHVFPFHVAESRTAWVEAVRTDEKEARRSVLETLAPGNQSPVIAAAIGIPRKEADQKLNPLRNPLRVREDVIVTIRLRNVAGRPVRILKQPSRVEMSWPAGNAGYGSDLPAGTEKGDFVTLSPGQEIEIESKLCESFLIANPSERRLKLSYLSIGKTASANTWIGTIDVAFGSEWQGKREVEHVEETWANGNLKPFFDSSGSEFRARMQNFLVNSAFGFLPTRICSAK